MRLCVLSRAPAQFYVSTQTALTHTLNHSHTKSFTHKIVHTHTKCHHAMQSNGPILCVSTNRTNHSHTLNVTMPCRVPATATLLCAATITDSSQTKCNDHAMQSTGHRHAFMCRYKVGFSREGRVAALDATLYSNVANSMVCVCVCVCVKESLCGMRDTGTAVFAFTGPKGNIGTAQLPLEHLHNCTIAFLCYGAKRLCLFMRT